LRYKFDNIGIDEGKKLKRKKTKTENLKAKKPFLRGKDERFVVTDNT